MCAAGGSVNDDERQPNRRKLFFQDFQVLRVRKRIYGQDLPSNRVLLKLRRKGESPRWILLNRDTFDLNKHYRATEV